jgi:hypothetical protein
MPGRPATADPSVAPAELRRDLQAFRSAFEEAAERAGVVEREIEVAGYRIRLRAAGSALIDQLWPAIDHLEVEQGRAPDTEPADLTIALWDSASTGVDPPPFGWMTAPAEDVRIVRTAHAAGLRIAYRGLERELVALDLSQRFALMWRPDHTDVPPYIRASPFFMIVTWWMRLHDVYPVHSGAVGDRGGGVLLVGQGGSGKSTTSIACLLDGMTYASDDYVLLEHRQEPYAWSLYSTAKLEPAHAERFPMLEPVLDRRSPAGEKYLAYLHAFRPDRVVRGFPIRAVVAPMVTQGSTATLRPMRRAEALAALAPSTLLALPTTRDASTFAAMADVVRTVPSFRLEIGSDLSSIAPALRTVIEAS